MPTIMQTEFTTSDIGKALGIPRERLKDWMNLGYVRPKIPAEGAGTKAIFSIQDLYKICLFQHLLNHGFRRDHASEIVNFFEERVLPNDSYLIIRYNTMDEEGAVASRAANPVSQESRAIIDLRTGIAVIQNDKDALRSAWGAPIQAHDPENGGENWDHMVLINIKNIRSRVEKVVAKL